MFAEDAADGGADQLARDGVRALERAFVFELELPGDGGEGGVNVSYARGGHFFADTSGALLGVAYDAFERGDRQALAYAGAAIDTLVLARLEGDFFYDLT